MESDHGFDSTWLDRDPSTMTKRAHPHFDDRGTLDWHTTFAEAQAAARSAKKRLFIDVGREL
jgi:hypothetical protein